MYKRFISAMYAINIVAQSIFSLLTPAALMFAVAWLLVKKAGTPEWLYAVFITLGIIAGLISMVRFAITASENLERLEKQRENNKKTGHTTNEK